MMELKIIARLAGTNRRYTLTNNKTLILNTMRNNQELGSLRSFSSHMLLELVDQHRQPTCMRGRRELLGGFAFLLLFRYGKRLSVATHKTLKSGFVLGKLC